MKQVAVHCYVCGGYIYSRLQTGGMEESRFAHSTLEECVTQLRKRFEALEERLELNVTYVAEKN
jgi:hypothetical protein